MGNAYASCDDQKLCPKVLKRDIVFKTTCGRRLLPEGNEIVDQPMHDFNQEGEEDEDAMQARKLHKQFENYRARVDNSDNYHEGDVMEGKFILNSLHHLMAKKNIEATVSLTDEQRRQLDQFTASTTVASDEQRRRLGLTAAITDATDDLKKKKGIPEEEAKAKDSGEEKKRQQYDEDKKKKKKKKK